MACKRCGTDQTNLDYCGDCSFVAELQTYAAQLESLLSYLRHGNTCDYLQPMWHKGPCDCGLFALIDKLNPAVKQLVVEAAGKYIGEPQIVPLVKPILPEDT